MNWMVKKFYQRDVFFKSFSNRVKTSIARHFIAYETKVNSLERSLLVFSLFLRCPFMGIFIFFGSTMKLITRQLLAKFAKVWSQAKSPDPLIICKFCYGWFIPLYVTEFDQVEQRLWGIVNGNLSNLRTFSLGELENFRGKWGRFKRDKSFKPCRFSELKKQEYGG